MTIGVVVQCRDGKQRVSGRVTVGLEGSVAVWELEKEKGKGVGRCEVEKIKGMRRRVTIGGVVQCGDGQQRI